MPVLTVTGTVIASLRPTKGRGRYWQFSSPELLTTYTDWQKAIADIAFAEKQIHSIRQLADNRVRAQDTLVARLKKLVEAGTDTEKDLAAAQTELLQAQIQGRKDIHEAETMLRVAQQSEAALSRQLQQAGVDPSLLRVTATEMDIVVADVPEGLVSRVRLGQKCEAKFSCLAGKQFSGNVRVISPVLSKERRSLRVLFVIDDPDDLLRPGMFADIGLGTDERESIQVPLAGVVHVDRADYLLVRAPDGDWQVTAVEVGEANQGSVEILDGIRSGSQIVAQGAILLKPLIVETMQRPRSRETGSK
jgi:multidrug efflux pump subunit AcrA (membrane-fusion protein)